MSDAVSNMDVEDVLSSIRRLVSEEAKTADQSPAGQFASTSAPQSMPANPTQPVASDAPQAAETPDVLADSEAEVAAEPKDGPLPQFKAYDRHHATPDLSAAVDEDDGDAASGVVNLRLKSPIDGRTGGQHPEPQPRISEEPDARLVLTEALRVALDDDEAGSGDTQSDPARAAGYLRAVESQAAEEDESAERPVATPRPMPGFLTKETAPLAQDFDTAPLAQDSDTAPLAQDTSDNSIESENGDDAPDFSRFSFRPEDALFDRASRAMDAAAEVEKSAQPAPSVAAPTLSHTRAEPAEEAQEPESATAEKTAADENDIPSVVDFAEEDESILDEDTLRDMVVTMVREELQGELGDRITRNVRKLVRREIQRSIASKEFE